MPTCPVCGNHVKNKKNVTCSRSCANTFFRSGVNNGQHRKGKENYRAICFLYHERRCIICGEENSLEIHHINLNHKDNCPTNLCVLCSNHHQYFHSKKLKHLVEQKIKDYHEQFLYNFPILDKLEVVYDENHDLY